MNHRKTVILTVMGATLAVVLGAVAMPPTDADPRRPMILRAVTHYRAGRLERAADLAERIATDPVAPQLQAWIVAAGARQAQGDRVAAARAYRSFLQACHNAPARTYATEQLAICRRGDRPRRPPTPPSKKLSPEQRRGLGAVDERLFIESSEHFVVQSHNSALSKLVVDLAEQALRRITAVVMPPVEYPHSVQISIYTSREQYRQKARHHRHWSGGRFELSIDRDGFAHRTIHLVQFDDAGQFDTQLLDRILPHELCHLVLTEWFGDSHCPLYLQEGLAMLAEYGDHGERILRAGAAVAAGETIRLGRLTAAEEYDRQGLDLFYAQTYSFMAFLHERLTARQFSDLLGHIKTGCTLRDALHRALLLPYSDRFMQQLEKAWQEEALAQGQFLSSLKQAGEKT